MSSHLLHCKGQSHRYGPGWGKPHSCDVVLFVGEGSERKQCHLLSCLQAFSHFSCYPQANWALLVLIPRCVGGGCVCFRTLWVCLSNELSCEAGSFSCCCDPHRFLLANVLRLYFPTLEPWLVQSVLFPSCSPQFIHTQMWDCPLCQLQPCLPWSFSRCAGCPSMPLLPV